MKFLKKQTTLTLLAVAIVSLVGIGLYQPAPAYAQGTTSCSTGGSFLGFPTWYKYLEKQTIDQNISDTQTVTVCQPILRSITDVWLVIAAVIEILLRVAVLISVGFIIWGGIQIMSSQGDPNGIKTGRETVINALIGLLITVFATVAVNFVAGRF